MARCTAPVRASLGRGPANCPLVVAATVVMAAVTATAVFGYVPTLRLLTPPYRVVAGVAEAAAGVLQKCEGRVVASRLACSVHPC